MRWVYADGSRVHFRGTAMLWLSMRSGFVPMLDGWMDGGSLCARDARRVALNLNLCGVEPESRKSRRTLEAHLAFCAISH